MIIQYCISNLVFSNFTCRKSSWLEAQKTCQADNMTLSTYGGGLTEHELKHHIQNGLEMGDVIFIGLKRNEQVMCN